MKAKFNIPSAWSANLIVLISGACIMIVELSAGRILAPYVGVSLYTWTTIIGVIMGGISLGNYLGGKIADRFPSRGALGLLLFASGLASLSILPAVTYMGGHSLPSNFQAVDRIVIWVSAIFFLPALTMGAITPVVIKLALKDLRQAGGLVGAMYAFNCFGSIFGTFATGFFLISWLGTRAVIWLVALTLLLLGAFFGQSWRSKSRAVTLLLALAVFGSAFNWRDDWRAPAIVESNYYTIAISNRSVDNQPVKALTLDYLIHSYVEMGNPLFLGYGYHKIFAELTNYVRQGIDAPRALFIGGGGYNFPRYIEVVYPQADIDVIEIDPAVTQVAYDQLGLPRDTRIKTFNMDARMFFIDYGTAPRYDLIFGDAFNDLSIPYHLTTYEFNQQVKASLRPGGIYVANVIDDYHEGNFLRSYIQTLKLSYKHVYLIEEEGSLDVHGRLTHVVVATDRVLDRDDFQRVSLEKGSMTAVIVDDEVVNDYLEQKPGITFTDDYAPVDNIVAPIFAQRDLP